jgi:3-oxoadipate enol-lactonase
VQAPDHYFEFEGNRLRYCDTGNAGEARAIVFIHGWTLDLDIWEPQVAEFRRAFRVIRFDRRGFGLSSGRPCLADDVRDLRGLLDHLELAQVTVVGMSQGARVGLSFALASAHRVSSLVLDGPPSYAADAETGADEDLPLARYRELVRTSGIDAFRREWHDHPFVRLRTGDANARALLDRVLARYPGRDLVEPPPTSNQRIDTRSLAALRKPVLVVNGEFDTASRRQAGELLVRILPSAEHALVPQAGHLANLDNTPAYNEIVRGFLQRQSRVAA